MSRALQRIRRYAKTMLDVAAQQECAEAGQLIGSLLG